MVDILKLTNQEQRDYNIARLANAGTILLDAPINSNTPVRMQCECGHIHSTTITLKLRGLAKLKDGDHLQCANCVGKNDRARKSTSRSPEELKNELLTFHNIEVVRPDLGRIKTKYVYRCLICKHEWEALLTSVFQSRKKYGTTGCPKCTINNSTEQIRRDNLQYLVESNLELLTPDYNGESSHQSGYIRLRHACGLIFDATPANVIYGKRGCPNCPDTIF